MCVNKLEVFIYFYGLLDSSYRPKPPPRPPAFVSSFPPAPAPSPPPSPPSPPVPMNIYFCFECLGKKRKIEIIPSLPSHSELSPTPPPSPPPLSHPPGAPGFSSRAI